MTDQRELDRILGAFFVEGTNELPDRVISAALEQIDHTPQRHAARMSWRFPTMNTYARFAAAAVLGLFVLGGIVYLAGLREPPVGEPSPTPIPSVRPSQIAQPAGVLVFSRAVGEEGRLWVANADGTGAHELASDLGGCQGDPAWSPDGTRLLFSQMENCEMSGLGERSTRLYLTDASGSEPQMVDTGCVSPCVSEFHGVFSTDGQRILFLRLKIIDPPPSATPEPPFGKPARSMEVKVLMTMDLPTGRVTELGTFESCNACGSPWPRSLPRWSPDRSQIVFDQEIAPKGPSDHLTSAMEVYVADADGGNVRQLSPSGSFGGWSPDGTRIVFQGERYTWVGEEIRWFSDIYTIRPDGTDLRRLTTDELSTNPAWSEDGRIWFVRTPMVDGNLQTAGPAQYWVMDADGSDAVQLSGPPPEQAWLLQPTP